MRSVLCFVKNFYQQMQSSFLFDCELAQKIFSYWPEQIKSRPHLVHLQYKMYDCAPSYCLTVVNNNSDKLISVIMVS